MLWSVPESNGNTKWQQVKDMLTRVITSMKFKFGGKHKSIAGTAGQPPFPPLRGSEPRSPQPPAGCCVRRPSAPTSISPSPHPSPPTHPHPTTPPPNPAAALRLTSPHPPIHTTNPPLSRSKRCRRNKNCQARANFKKEKSEPKPNPFFFRKSQNDNRNHFGIYFFDKLKSIIESIVIVGYEPQATDTHCICVGLWHLCHQVAHDMVGYTNTRKKTRTNSLS